MPEIPECLSRRYTALDELIQELSALSSVKQSSCQECRGDSTTDPGIRLMCDFWSILKENPDCDLSQAVKQSMGVQEAASTCFQQRVACYMAGRSCGSANSSDINQAMDKIKDIEFNTRRSDQSFKCNNAECYRSPKSKGRQTTPLSKALCNLKEAASFDKNCNERINELMKTQEDLKTQIQRLELKEKQGVQRLKEADRLWCSMEDAYKRKIQESFDRQKELLTQLKEIEKSNNKWRKCLKDLERQTKCATEAQIEINEKISQKNNDIKCLETEIENITRKIDSNKHYTNGVHKTIKDKKEASEAKVAAIQEEIKNLKAILKDVQNNKNNKQEEGQTYVKEAREDLQKICKTLLQKKLENEDLTAEKEAIGEEITFLKQSYDLCKEKCKNKKEHIVEELKIVTQDIEECKVRCKRCHQNVDTNDARRLCNDCARCKDERECKVEGDHCERESGEDCVCIAVKEKFLCNVFDNMCAILEEKSKTPEGKAVAEAILSCLQNSKNGKLSAKARQLVQDFVLKTLKKNMNLTVVGGAVKTRCEMDSETYRQLMTCLKYVKDEKLSKADKGTEAKKASCRRWESSNECNCPGGGNSCSCGKKVPQRKPRQDTSSTTRTEKVPSCLKRESSCGPDCYLKAVPSVVGTDVTKGKPGTVASHGCPFSKNMRAAQCVLGPESLSSMPKSYLASSSYIADTKASIRSGKIRSQQSSVSRRDGILVGKGLNAIMDSSYDTCSTQVNHLVSDSSNDFPLKKVNKEIVAKSLLNSPGQRFKPLLNTSSNCTKPWEAGYKRDISLKGNKREDVTNKHYMTTSKNTQQNELLSFLPLYTKPENEGVESEYELIDLLENKSTKNVNNMPRCSKKTNLHKMFKSHNWNKELRRITKDTVPTNDKLSIQWLPINKNERKKLISENKSDADKLITDKFNAKSKTVTVKLKNDLGIHKTVKAPTTKTFSGNVAVDINKFCDDISMKSSEHSVDVEKSNSDTLILTANSNGTHNAVIRKTESGSLKLIVSDSFFQTKENTKSATSVEKFYKVKIKSTKDCIAEPPALLKLTESNNYIFVPDKEYENRFKQTVHEVFKDDTEYYLNMSCTDSDNCILNVDNNEMKEPNALVVKQKSGYIKVMSANKSLLTENANIERKSVETTAKAVDQLLHKWPCKTKDNHVTSRPSSFTKKSSSDSNIFKKIKLFNSDHKDFPVEPSAILQMSSSGQYTVVMDKESKNNLVKNLKNYLKSNIEDALSVNKSNSGEITIALTSEHNDKTQYGSLKITPSGNLYLIINKELIKGKKSDLTKTDEQNARATNTISNYLIEPQINRAVTTTCNALPDSECDATKCVCADLKCKSSDWVHSLESDKCLDLNKPQFCEIDWKKVKMNPDGSFKVCDAVCVGNCPANKVRPHIVISPCAAEPSGRSDLHSIEQCFFVIEAVSPFPKKMSAVPVRKKPNSDWDSLAYLPPQLPAFLKEVKIGK